MKVLLDTHAFIWWDGDSIRLSPQILALCKNRNNILMLSVASIWEIQSKFNYSESNTIGCDPFST